MKSNPGYFYSFSSLSSPFILFLRSSRNLKLTPGRSHGHNKIMEKMKKPRRSNPTTHRPRLAGRCMYISFIFTPKRKKSILSQICAHFSGRESRLLLHRYPHHHHHDHRINVIAIAKKNLRKVLLTLLRNKIKKGFPNEPLSS